MADPAAPNRPRPCGARDERGFTLVELMIVLVIIGLASAVVVLTLPAANGGARAEAITFAARAAALRDRAVVEGRTMGLWATASGYGFERREGGQWAPLTDRTLARDDWRRGTAVSIDGGNQGRLSFDRVGLPDAPMTLEFTAGGSVAKVVINAGGEVAVQ